ncbi:hypothetical protein [Streptomyces rhizosphaerihabitans]|uniref:hypothetical protein n=1 Tax=Streptomyces rhizosphaerihabitans TaxID=1266770 RepID=UPI0021C1632E|nr:hypothetical protein [Streptomyces rhizosphaerihabitans]MCT9010796.1 hypothetical protein [Streptomyces rhizosphaerihabitans]
MTENELTEEAQPEDTEAQPEDARPMVVKLGGSTLDLNIDPADEFTLGMLGIDPQTLSGDPEAATEEVLRAAREFSSDLANLVPQLFPFMTDIEGWAKEFDPFPPAARNRLHEAFATTSEPEFDDLFESSDGRTRFDLIPYMVGFEEGNQQEPLVSFNESEGTEEFTVTLFEEGQEMSEILELPHLVAVSLRRRIPAAGGESATEDIPFPAVAFGDSESVLIARMPLTGPKQRRQLLAALSSPKFETSVIVRRGVTLEIPTGSGCEDSDNADDPCYRETRLILESVAAPSPLVLSEAQRSRFGAGGALPAMECTRVTYGDRSFPYWQDPVRPERFYYLPDRFLLARLPDSGHRPALKVRAVGAGSQADLRFTMEFSALPVTDQIRLKEALAGLEDDARRMGAVDPVRLEVLQEAQPILRLALPQDGAPGSELTERDGALIDLEREVTHAETLKFADFQLVYQALFGASLSVLRGEIRVGAGGGPQEDIPLELRLDRTAGEVLALEPGAVAEGRIAARLTNVIESVVHLEQPTAVALCGTDRVALRIEGLQPGLRLAPGEGADVQLVPRTPLPGAGFDAIHLNESGIVAEPDRKVVWDLVFDRSVEARLTREVTVEAVTALFAGPVGSTDRVAAFVVTLEHGGSVRLTEDQLAASTTVSVPVEPLLTGAQAPPIRYRTETLWQSGGIGVSPWRETDNTILLPVKVVPPPDPPPAGPPPADGPAVPPPPEGGT